MSISEMNRWSHPDVILVATDLSELDRLMPFAFDQAADTGARLILLHILAATESLAVDAAGLPYYDPSGAVDYANKALVPFCLSARQRGIVCDRVVREGNAAQQIVAAARQ